MSDQDDNEFLLQDMMAGKRKIAKSIGGRPKGFPTKYDKDRTEFTKSKILSCLASRRKPISISKLSRETGVAYANLLDHVNKLISDNVVKESPGSHGARLVEVVRNEP
jgi:hypothetical protein